MLQWKAEQTLLLPEVPPPCAEELCTNTGLQDRQEGNILPAKFPIYFTTEAKQSGPLSSDALCTNVQNSGLHCML